VRAAASGFFPLATRVASPDAASIPIQPFGSASPCASNRKRDGTDAARLPYFARSWPRTA
jgi:hypothetical protein